MKVCSACGALVSQRSCQAAMCYGYVCEQCRAIHYHYPRTIAGCIPEREDRIFLCRLAIAPRLRFWTYPDGFMEIGETTEEAAILLL